VGRYFSYRRALGIDHFDASYRTKPFVREGIFRFTRNGMYTFGLMIVWLPGLIWASKAALLSAAFSHLYIWVHYFCTELPDMRRIYGEARADGVAEQGDPK
jgi:protein-S-isoprenylcysteine O-methyltransferase Ste14